MSNSDKQIEVSADLVDWYIYPDNVPTGLDWKYFRGRILTHPKIATGFTELP